MLFRSREENGELFNTAAVIHANGKIDYRDKILLPTYDVFDEARYFTSATCVEPVQIMVSGKPVSVGVQICEDLWDDEYSQKVTQQLAEKGASVMVNISASPFCLDRHKERIQEERLNKKRLNEQYLDELTDLYEKDKLMNLFEK